MFPISGQVTDMDFEYHRVSQSYSALQYSVKEGIDIKDVNMIMAMFQ